MKKQAVWFVLGVALVGTAQAQYPILDAVATRVIEKYQSASCEELWQKRSAPKSPEEERALAFLEQDPQARTIFIDKVAGAVVNKMFTCGMIP